jgi:hypothetical protein
MKMHKTNEYDVTKMVENYFRKFSDCNLGNNDEKGKENVRDVMAEILAVTKN